MIDHNAIAKKLDQMSLNFEKKLSVVLRIDVVLVDFEKLFIDVYDVDNFEIAHESVEDDFILVINNRDAVENLIDVEPHHFAININFLD